MINMRQHALCERCMLLLVVIFLNGCAQTYQKGLYPAQSNLVWPSKPAAARIAYVGQFHHPENMGISKGILEHLGDLFVGSSDRHMVRPMAVIALSPDEIYVADPGVKGVHYFNRKTEEYRLILRKGDQAFPSPVAMTKGPNNSILVSDSALAQVYQIKPKAEYATVFPLQTKLQQPTGLAYDKKYQRLYVADTRAHAIRVFDQQGRQIKKIGKRGKKSREFNFPTLIWFDDRRKLYVTDSLNHRVQIFDAGGRFINTFGQAGMATGTLARPKGVATDNLGHIYIVDALFHALQVFDNKGRLLLSIGQQGKQTAEFWLPAGIYIGENNTIYIADSYNRRVQVFKYIGGKS